jgi:hypothetical protein
VVFLYCSRYTEINQPLDSVGLLFFGKKSQKRKWGTPQYGSNKKKVRRESQEAIQMA